VYFKSGTTQNWNEVRLETPTPTESPQVNTGLTFYNRNAIAFDAVRGLVGLKPLQAPTHHFESDCDEGEVSNRGSQNGNMYTFAL
jgi:hypothetical protein